MTAFTGNGRFLSRRCLGQGSFGAVYEVFDRERQEAVALKLPHDPTAQNLFLFKHEFRALADIRHPNLILFHELISDGSQWYFTMELLDGLDLLRFLRAHPERTACPPEPPPQPSSSSGGPASALEAQAPDGPEEDLLPAPSPPRDLARVVETFRQLAHGLMAIHQAGLLHQDIKPSNILVTGEGRVVLLDFGLAAELDPAGPEGGAAFETTGTPAYMAPEQLLDNRCTASSDWYGVGVLLYQVLTGRLPFRGNGMRALVSKVTQLPPAPRELIPGLPESLSGLCMRLLDPRPDRRPTGPEFLHLLDAPGSQVLDQPTAEPPALLVGRARELDFLCDAFQALRSGKPGWVNLHGSSGLGKTFLLRCFRREIHRMAPETLILGSRCYEQEDLPFKALDGIVDALGHHLRRLPVPQLDAILPRHARALAQVFPVLQEIPRISENRRRPGLIDPQVLRHRAFAALRDLLHRIGEKQPLVLIIDDLQWGDADSAALLVDLLHSGESPRMLLVASFRTEEMASSPALKEFMALKELLLLDRPGQAPCLDLPLKELSDAEARSLAGSLLGAGLPDPQDAAARIAAESKGNPFFIQELARHAHGLSGSRDLMSHLVARTRQLPAGAQDILGLVCLAGYPLEWHLLREASRTAEKGNDYLDALRQSHLVRIRKEGEHRLIEPYHDYIRKAVTGSRDAAWCRTAHQRLAEALEAQENPDVQALAAHFSAAGETDKAIGYLAEAGQQAMAALAFGRAAELFRQSLALRRPEDPGWVRNWADLGNALTNAGRSHEAAEIYLQAAQRVAPEHALRFRRTAALEYLRSGHYEKGLATLRGILDAMRIRLPRSQAGTVLSTLLLRTALRLRGLRFSIRTLDEIPQALLDRQDALWLATVGLATGDPMCVAGVQARHLLLSLRTGEPSRLVRALTYEALCTSALGADHEATAWKHLDPAFELAERLGDTDSLTQATVAAGITHMAVGKWRKAAETLDRLEARLQDAPMGLAYELRNARLYALMSHYILGNLKLLAGRLPALIREAEETGDLLFMANLRTSPAFIHHLACDEPEAARQGIRGIMDRLPADGFAYQRHMARIALCNIALYEGRTREAWEEFEPWWLTQGGTRMGLVQALRITISELRARMALALAGEMDEDPQRTAFLAVARREARRLRREGVGYAMALHHRLRALEAWIAGRREEAMGLALLSETAFEACDMSLHAVAMKRCRGLMKGDPGRELVQEAEAWMHHQGIVHPDRLMRMFLPGLDLQTAAPAQPSRLSHSA